MYKGETYNYHNLSDLFLYHPISQSLFNLILIQLVRPEYYSSFDGDPDCSLRWGRGYLH
jgi:hypothetical protein